VACPILECCCVNDTSPKHTVISFPPASLCWLIVHQYLIRQPGGLWVPLRFSPMTWWSKQITSHWMVMHIQHTSESRRRLLFLVSAAHELLCFAAGGYFGRLHILFVVPHGSTVSARSCRRHVLPVVHFSAVFLLHGLAEGKLDFIHNSTY